MAHEEALAVFERWYAAPIEKLRELPDGDGGFAALIIALPLYERLIAARLKLAGGPTDEEAVRAAMNEDLQLTAQERARFWAIFRVGFMHQAMGQAGRTPWLVSHQFAEKPDFRLINGVEVVCLDPWKFAERVLREFRQCPELIAASESFPLAGIFSVLASDLAPDRREA